MGLFRLKLIGVQVRRDLPHTCAWSNNQAAPLLIRLSSPNKPTQTLFRVIRGLLACLFNQRIANQVLVHQVQAEVSITSQVVQLLQTILDWLAIWMPNLLLPDLNFLSLAVMDCDLTIFSCPQHRIKEVQPLLRPDMRPLKSVGSLVLSLVYKFCFHKQVLPSFPRIWAPFTWYLTPLIPSHYLVLQRHS